jgi:GNAT superfamily N-acetyltransferase
MRQIHVLSTGGTIEKIYSEQRGSVENVESRIEPYLARLRLPDTRIDTTRLMNKDSLEMADADRALILDAIRERLDAPVVISHGTDTMVETGMYLKRALGHLEHPVILTGAMTPLGFEGSDALQNLTESFFAARVLAPGVYIVMHNQAFPVDRVRKDKDLARFVRIEGEPYTLRAHRPGDMGWIVHRHGVLYWHEYAYDERFEALVAEIVAHFIQNFDPAREHCWIAEHDGEPVGSVFLVRQSDDIAKLRLLLVEPAARGSGLGRRLVRECVDFARAAGYRKIVLWTQSELTAARRVYEGAGFTLAGGQRHDSWGRSGLVAETWELAL